MSGHLYLGIDGGQSSTTALIADENGRILGRGRGGPCNHVASGEGRAKFFSAVGGCVTEACNDAGLSAEQVLFSAACLGFSGGAEDKAQYATELIRSSKYKVSHDAEIALSGAHAGQPGIIIIAGTGSMAFGRNAAGVTARAGGWGYIYGDEGGAFDLTRRALRAALRHEEGWGPATALHSLLLEKTGAPDANALLHRLYTPELSRTEIAALAPLVTEAAESGDAAAQQILIEAATQLTWYVEGVYHRLFEAGQRVPIAYIGGVFQSPPLSNAFGAEVRTRMACEVRPPRYGPAAGAVLEALGLDGNQSMLSNVPEGGK